MLATIHPVFVSICLFEIRELLVIDIWGVHKIQIVKSFHPIISFSISPEFFKICILLIQNSKRFFSIASDEI